MGPWLQWVLPGLPNADLLPTPLRTIPSQRQPRRERVVAARSQRMAAPTERQHAKSVALGAGPRHGENHRYDIKRMNARYRTRQHRTCKHTNYSVQRTGQLEGQGVRILCWPVFMMKQRHQAITVASLNHGDRVPHIIEFTHPS